MGSRTRSRAGLGQAPGERVSPEGFPLGGGRGPVGFPRAAGGSGSRERSGRVDAGHAGSFGGSVRLAFGLGGRDRWRPRHAPGRRTLYQRQRTMLASRRERSVQPAWAGVGTGGASEWEGKGTPGWRRRSRGRMDSHVGEVGYRRTGAGRPVTGIGRVLGDRSVARVGRLGAVEAAGRARTLRARWVACHNVMAMGRMRWARGGGPLPWREARTAAGAVAGGDAASARRGVRGTGRTSREAIHVRVRPRRARVVGAGPGGARSPASARREVAARARRGRCRGMPGPVMPSGGDRVCGGGEQEVGMWRYRCTWRGDARRREAPGVPTLVPCRGSDGRRRRVAGGWRLARGPGWELGRRRSVRGDACGAAGLEAGRVSRLRQAGRSRLAVALAAEATRLRWGRWRGRGPVRGSLGRGMKQPGGTAEEAWIRARRCDRRVARDGGVRGLRVAGRVLGGGRVAGADRADSDDRHNVMAGPFGGGEGDGAPPGARRSMG